MGSGCTPQHVFIYLCLDLAYYSAWAEGAPPESAPHTVSAIDFILRDGSSLGMDLARIIYIFGMEHGSCPNHLYFLDGFSLGLDLAESFIFLGWIFPGYGSCLIIYIEG